MRLEGGCIIYVLLLLEILIHANLEFSSEGGVTSAVFWFAIKVTGSCQDRVGKVEGVYGRR